MNSPHVVSVDKQSKGLKVPSKRLRKTSLRDDFWSSSACEMENSTFPSLRSISSISTSNPALDPHSNSGTTSSTSEFVNHGKRLASLRFIALSDEALAFLNTEVYFFGIKRGNNGVEIKHRRSVPHADTSYETLLGTNKLFPQPIPLPEMVDFLVDVWEQEGLYDKATT
ncbi:hypothetical protein KY290_030480 [Solanum tuberosum]|uniref:Gag1-like clamp domain-containing protein n=1 Tax=Solanum tuberosum TaxID=4113 RepID=A0ABQ7UNR0_SOLTU|nr:hypothetical protein KY290_030480 [Solanum tuberosum]